MASQRRNVDLNSCQTCATVSRAVCSVIMDCAGAANAESDGSAIMAATIQPREPSERSPASDTRRKTANAPMASEPRLVKAAGAAAIHFATERAHHAAASGDSEHAETGAQEQEANRPARIEARPVERCQQRDRGGGSGNHEPGAAAHPEVSDRSPEKIDGVGEREQREMPAARAGSTPSLRRR